ncbi:Ig-like domain-containing protein [Ekhidna sp.]|uniref:Ig-like domain-containing protein n=1 Tax=Ekhidna sp. TaxID=2608089 RepID=UPI003515C0CF
MKSKIKILVLAISSSLMTMLISCGDDGDASSTSNINISTSTPTDITSTTATLGGNVTGEGVFSAGIVFSQTNNPSIENATSILSTTTSGSYTVSVTGLSSNGTYFVKAFALTEDGEAVYGDLKSFTTEEVDTTAPTLVSMSPNGTETAVSINTSIIYTFSEPMDVNTFIAPGGSAPNNVFLSGGLYGNDVPFTISASGNDIILTPLEELDGGELLYSYGLFADDITDLAGNSLDIEAGEGNGLFTTENTPLTITSILPSLNETGVDLDANIVVTFSNTLDPNFVSSEAFTLFSNKSGQLSGTVTVSGNKVTFDPSGELDDFMTYHNFYVEGYGSLQIRDVNGNYFPEEGAYSFSTEAFSENYYYEFDGNYGYAADNLDITYNGGTSYTVNVSSGSNYTSMSWRFVKAIYNGQDVYTITNKLIDNNGHEIYIEAAAPDDGNKILTSARPSSTTWYTGQFWTVEWSGNNSNGFLLKAVVPNAYLSSIDLDINATIASPYPYEHEWLVTRRAAYSGD